MDARLVKILSDLRQAGEGKKARGLRQLATSAGDEWALELMGVNPEAPSDPNPPQPEAPGETA